MNQIYMSQPDQYSASPMSFSAVPELMSSAYDDDTDPSPSPPVTYSNDMHYNAYDYMPQPQPTIINSVEFTDLTHLQASDRARWQQTQQRRSNGSNHTNPTTSETNNNSSKEAASSMRIRRRAQNRASQRAFRERKEKHVQHLEHELELLESKHQHLAKSYSQVDSERLGLRNEVELLRSELASLRSSREGSTGTVKLEGGFGFDPFAGGEGYFPGDGGF